MKRLLEVCVVAFSLVTTPALPSAPPTPAVARSIEGGAAQELQAGISVELAPTKHAVALPDADQRDALVVSITKDGRVYDGIDLVDPKALTGKVRRVLTTQKGKKVYLKADARTAYGNVARVLDALRAAGVEAPNLLTGQKDSPEPHVPVPPKGLEVWADQPSRAHAAVMQVQGSGQQPPTLEVDDQPTAWAALPHALEQRFSGWNEKAVLIKAEPGLAYGQVVAVIDICRSADAKVVLFTPGP